MAENQASDIVVTSTRLAPEELNRLVQQFFKDMVKLVVDIRLGRLAIGGELHADAEKLLLESGSAQADLWGANYYPDKPPTDCIEYTSLINIRPSQDNPSMEIQDPGIRESVRRIVFALVGEGMVP